MGKKSSQKGEKGKVEEPPPAEEGVSLTGDLRIDLPALCQEAGLPSIAVRTLPAQEPRDQDSEEVSKEGEAVDHAAITVLVEYEDAPPKLKSVHIRGWLVTTEVIAVLEKALGGSQLNSLKLWNTGLNPTTLTSVCHLTAQLKIKCLSLDGNPLSSLEPLTSLLTDDNLERLSLKCCSITPATLPLLTSALTSNKSLLVLDLSCNHLGDEGAGLVASTLRLNRSLLSLSLANNGISDSGVIRLAEVLSRFSLNHEEVVTRRKLLSQRRMEDGVSTVDLSLDTKRSPSSTSLERSSRAKSTAKSGKKGETKKEEKGKKGGDGGGKKGRGKDVRSGRKEVVEEVIHPVPVETTIHPLLETLEEGAGHQLFLPGNMCLVHLTLSHNAITEEGVQAMEEAVGLQEKYSRLGPGLLRIALQHVLVAPTSPALQSLNQLLSTKAPSVSDEKPHDASH